MFGIYVFIKTTFCDSDVNGALKIVIIVYGKLELKLIYELLFEHDQHYVKYIFKVT